MAKPPKKKRSANTHVAFGGGLGGAIATIIVWASDTFFHLAIPTNVASAMALVLIVVGGWIGTKLN